MNWIPDDYARCEGVGNDAEGWREGCEHCLRRTVPVGPNAVVMVMMEPPKIIVFECVFLISPVDEEFSE